MYKLVRPDGYDFYSGTINYADNVGKIIREADFDAKEKGVCGKGLHASRNPNDCFINAKIPCRAFRVDGIQKIAGDRYKSRYQALKIHEEIMDLDALFGWRYTEAANPLNPLSMPPPEIRQEHIDCLIKWASVRASVGDSVGDSVWAYVGSMFPTITSWEYIKSSPGDYPYQPCMDLWKCGIIPSFDGKSWRLHGGKNADILYVLTM